MPGRYTPHDIVWRPLFFPLLLLIVIILVNDRFSIYPPPAVADSLLDRKGVFEGVIVEPPQVKQGKIKLKVESGRALVLLTIL